MTMSKSGLSTPSIHGLLGIKPYDVFYLKIFQLNKKYKRHPISDMNRRPFISIKFWHSYINKIHFRMGFFVSLQWNLSKVYSLLSLYNVTLYYKDKGSKDYNN
jgi:hypothetical protein